MTEPGKPDRTRWDVVALAVAASVVGALHVGKVPPALPLLREELALGLVAAGWAASLLNACGAALGVVAGLAVARVGVVRLLLSATAVMAIGGLIGAAASSGMALLLARLVEGIGFVALVVAAPTVISAAASPSDRRFALGLWSAYMPVGTALAMVAAAPILAHGGWRALWLAAAAAVLLLGAALAVLLAPRRWPDAPRPGARRDRAGSWAGLAAPMPWLYAAAMGCYTVQYFAVAAWLPTVLIEVQGLSVAAAASLSAAAVLSNAGGNILSAWAMHRGARRWRLMAIAELAMLAGAVGLFAAGAPDALRLPAAFLLLGAGGMLAAAALAGAPAHATGSAAVATASGLAAQGANLGSLLGPPAVAATVAALGGWQAAHWPILAAGVVTLALIAVLARVEGRPQGG